MIVADPSVFFLQIIITMVFERKSLVEVSYLTFAMYVLLMALRKSLSLFPTTYIKVDFHFFLAIPVLSVITYS